MDRDQATLADIYRAGLLLAEFSQDHTLATFLKDAKTQSAILHQLLVPCEAT